MIRRSNDCAWTLTIVFVLWAGGCGRKPLTSVSPAGDSRLAGVWAAPGVTLTRGDMISNYIFHPDGTMRYSLTSTDPKWQPENMEGTYTLTGSTLTITRTGGSMLDVSGTYAVVIGADEVTITTTSASPIRAGPIVLKRVRK